MTRIIKVSAMTLVGGVIGLMLGRSDRPPVKEPDVVFEAAPVAPAGAVTEQDALDRFVAGDLDTAIALAKHCCAALEGRLIELRVQHQRKMYSTPLQLDEAAALSAEISPGSRVENELRELAQTKREAVCSRQGCSAAGCVCLSLKLDAKLPLEPWRDAYFAAALDARVKDLRSRETSNPAAAFEEAMQVQSMSAPGSEPYAWAQEQLKRLDTDTRSYQAGPQRAAPAPPPKYAFPRGR